MQYWVCTICGYQDIENRNGKPLDRCPLCNNHCSFVDVAHSIPVQAYGGEGKPDIRLIEEINLHAHIH